MKIPNELHSLGYFSLVVKQTDAISKLDMMVRHNESHP